MWTRFIELAGEVNTQMPRWVFGKVVEALNERGKSVRGSRILVLGLSYKENIDDDRESPSYEIIEILREAGAEVGYCDPYFPTARPGRKHDLRLASAPCTAEGLAGYDAVVLATAHREFADTGLYAHVDLLVDTRNLVRSGPKRIVKA
jgi:UDP-N-acetyl-D-glucosamine dehydrogenase